jgi:2Fe-2S ferredoxin
VPKITFVQPDGRRETISATAGTTVKDCALDNDIPGIVGECGGALMCGTCHVYVDDADAQRTGTPEPQEVDMLDMVVADRRPGSRLSCQLVVTEALDGLVVHLPVAQK